MSRKRESNRLSINIKIRLLLKEIRSSGTTLRYISMAQTLRLLESITLSCKTANTPSMNRKKVMVMTTGIPMVMGTLMIIAMTMGILTTIAMITGTRMGITMRV